MKKRYRILLIAVFVVFLLLVRFVGEIGLDIAPHDRFRIVGVVDGDTVELPGDRLRLLGIDCPEKGQPFYDSAVSYMTALALGKTAGVAYSEKRRDPYSRMLGYVFLDDTLFVNAEMVRRGLAYVYLFDDNMADSAMVEALMAAQIEAIDAGVGLWSIPHEPEPYYVAGKNSRRFHRPECRSAKKFKPEERIEFETREEACRLGYSPCRNCRP